MKKYILNILSAICISLITLGTLCSCETVYASTTTYDDMYYENDYASIDIIVTYGTPYYLDGVLQYYIYRNLYYYPFYYNDIMYFRSFYRPLPPRHHYNFGRPHRGDIGFGHHRGHRPSHNGNHGGPGHDNHKPHGNHGGQHQPGHSNHGQHQPGHSNHGQHQPGHQSNLQHNRHGFGSSNPRPSTPARPHIENRTNPRSTSPSMSRPSAPTRVSPPASSGNRSFGSPSHSGGSRGYSSAGSSTRSIGGSRSGFGGRR